MSTPGQFGQHEQKPPPYHNEPYPHHPQQQPTYTPSYPQQHPTVSTVIVPATPMVVPGSCPICHNREWTGNYPCMAWFLCFFCFWNCGLCCCLCMRQKKCTKCGFSTG